MRRIKLILPVFVAFILSTSCTKDDVLPEENQNTEEPDETEEEEVRNLEVENFIWEGLNEIYLYKKDVPELADQAFKNNKEKENFFLEFENPEDLFYEGLRADHEDFSFLVDDYVSLENSFDGISRSDGMGLGLQLYGEDKVLAYVQYVLPNSPAEVAGIQRGDMFIYVDGVQMNLNNYSSLLNKNSFEIEIAYLDGNTITPTGEKVSLAKEQYNTNPVYMVKTIDYNGHNVGYLMYNGFTGTYNQELNAAFANLKSANVTDLILDLRYNGGGSVETAVGLAGMITGQYTGEVFLKEHWNEKYQRAWPSESYIQRFKNDINISKTASERLNSLNLNRVYVLTTRGTASASELIINGLEPYINVVQVGTTTTGKFQASITLYDSPNFLREGATKNHTYAMQPLVFKSANSAGKTDYTDGLAPDIEIREDIANLGTLGDVSEPLLNAALRDIAGEAQNKEQIYKAQERSRKFKFLGQSGMDEPTYQRMYIDKLPSER